MARHGCYWYLADDSQCGKAVKYHMEPDGGEPGAALVRKYDPFCEFHMKKWKERDDEA